MFRRVAIPQQTDNPFDVEVNLQDRRQLRFPEHAAGGPFRTNLFRPEGQHQILEHIIFRSRNSQKRTNQGQNSS